MAAGDSALLAELHALLGDGSLLRDPAELLRSREEP